MYQTARHPHVHLLLFYDYMMFVPIVYIANVVRHVVFDIL